MYNGDRGEKAYLSKHYHLCWAWWMGLVCVNSPVVEKLRQTVTQHSPQGTIYYSLCINSIVHDGIYIYTIKSYEAYLWLLVLRPERQYNRYASTFHRPTNGISAMRMASASTCTAHGSIFSNTLFHICFRKKRGGGIYFNSILGNVSISRGWKKLWLQSLFGNIIH